MITERKRKKWKIDGKIIKCLTRFSNRRRRTTRARGRALHALQPSNFKLQSSTGMISVVNFSILIDYLHFIEFVFRSPCTVCTVYNVYAVSIAFHTVNGKIDKTHFIFSVHCCHRWHSINIRILTKVQLNNDENETRLKDISVGMRN